MSVRIIPLLLCCLSVLTSMAQQHPKREFRGAWLHTVSQGQYKEMNPEQTRAYLVDQLNKLERAGINAVLFQVRPQADAFYISELEPWSRFVTGTAGQAPTPLWDPLAFMIEECHKRNMELHAWLNPYRVTTSNNEVLPPNHVFYKHPEWFVTYDGKKYFDPGLPQCRDFIVKVVNDIVTRYDVDAIHMDDYFYPYPKPGVPFPDEASYARYGNGMALGDWRRDNVNKLIEGIHEDIVKTKPWVRFGISPFGIYRNERNMPGGSKTNGLENYGDLYADVLLWTQKGWVDYMLPQLYWTLEHKVASSEVLIYWWNENTNGRHMYVGQDVGRTMDTPDLMEGSNQLAHKIQLSRYLDNIHGNCMWPGYSVTRNYKGIADELANNYHSKPALIPAYTFIDNKAPDEVKSLKAKWTEYGYMLSWKGKNTKDEMQKPVYYCIYRFAEGEPIDLSRGDALVTTTRNTAYKLPYEKGNKSYVYVVTAVDRCHNESVKGKNVKVKL